MEEYRIRELRAKVQSSSRLRFRSSQKGPGHHRIMQAGCGKETCQRVWALLVFRHSLLFPEGMGSWSCCLDLAHHYQTA